MNAQKKREAFKALCMAGSLWAFAYMAISDAIINALIEEIATEEVNSKWVHDAFIAAAKSRQG